MASRGGKVGDYIMLSPKAITATGPWRKWYQNQLCRESKVTKESRVLPMFRILTDKNMIID